MNNTLVLLHFDDPNNITKDEVTSNKWKIIGTGLKVNSTNAKFGNALQFDGSASYLEKDGGITLGGADFTIDWWGLGKGNYNRNSGWWRFFDFNYSKNVDNCRVHDGVYFGYSNKRCSCINSTYIYTTVTLSEMHHHALVYQWDLKQLTAYVDGKKSGTATVTLPQSNLVNALIGYSNHTADSYLLGTIEEFRVSSCARWVTDFTPQSQQYIYGPYAEFPNTIVGTYDKSPNGLTYKYRVRFEQGPYTTTSNVVNYETCQKLWHLRALYKILIISIFFKMLKNRVVS